MIFTGDPAEVYRAIGVKQVINASGTTTMYGGSRLRPEAMEVMNKAASVLVNLDELNREAGKIIARMLNAEAAVVCSGSAGGLVLQAAACIAGKDPARMVRLPDTTGMKDEIIIHTAQRFGYDQMYRVAGAKLVNVGDGRRCNTWQLEAGFTERTAAVAYLFSPFTSRRVLPLKTVCEIAHSHNVPVIVDAASMLPPRENLFKFIPEGADMVIYSGGKGIRGPQGTGILVGRADLIGNPKYRDVNTRWQYVDEVDKIIEDWTSQMGAFEAFHLLAEAGVPAGVTLNSTQMANDPHYLQSGILIDLDHPHRGHYRTFGCVQRLSDSVPYYENAPLLGQHNSEIYARYLGYTHYDLNKLKTEGVI